MSGHHGRQQARLHGLRTASSRAARPTTMGALVAVSLATGIAIGSGSPGVGALPLPGRTPEPIKLDDVSQVALHTGQTCPSLLDHYQAAGRDEVTPWGLGSVMGGGVMADGMRVPVAAAESSRAMGPPTPTPLNGSAAQASDSGRSQSGTTVQVHGVDEADLAKRAGDLLITVNPGADTFLRVLRTDAEAGAVRQVGAVELTGFPTSLLVEGDTVLVIGQALSGVNPAASGAEIDTRMMMPWRPPATRMDQIDISDPSRPKLVSSLVVDAAVAGARMVDGVAQLALTSSPGLVFPGPSDPSQPNEKQMLTRNRGVIDDSTIEDWLPQARFTEADGLATTRPLVACTDVAVPAEPAGVSTLTLLSADLRAGGLAQRRTTAVVASGTTLYADAEQTVVAMPHGGWRAWPADAAAGAPTSTSTVLHVFARQGRETVRYVASGEVPGQILNQFSIDAHDGYLRVATTEEPVVAPVPMPQPLEDSASTPGSAESGSTGSGSTGSESTVVAPSSPGTTQSRVTVLHQEGKRLVTVGTVKGLGKGERIYAVRFMGDLGYVVTFRRTDPLYVIDLSDPTEPRTAGELKIPGYSAYLQSAGEGLLLGLGQDADAQGRVKGLQLSLFDVTEPTDPQRIENVALPDAFSEAEFDHHAFTLVDGLVLVPYSKNVSAGLVATRLDGRSLTEATLLSRGQVPPQRSFVDGGHIWSVGPDGVVAYDVSSLERTGSVRYGL